MPALAASKLKCYVMPWMMSRWTMRRPVCFLAAAVSFFFAAIISSSLVDFAGGELGGRRHFDGRKRGAGVDKLRKLRL